MWFCYVISYIIWFSSVWRHLNVMYEFLYFVFFFFKQKTAYEMRISDWSSDVCSSDLICQRGNGDAADQVRRQPRHDAQVLADEHGDTGSLYLDEIGRASCRERVCQYV